MGYKHSTGNITSPVKSKVKKSTVTVVAATVAGATLLAPQVALADDTVVTPGEQASQAVADAAATVRKLRVRLRL